MPVLDTLTVRGNPALAFGSVLPMFGPGGLAAFKLGAQARHLAQSAAISKIAA